MSNKHGSIFLLTLTCMTVLFILGFSLTFFTGAEDYSSAMSYESEVAFNLAEGAVEEFVARLKNSLNHDDANNQLYKVLRSDKVDVSKEIPLEASQVAKLTAYTRETARQIYGIQFGRGLVESKDFVVDAVIRLQHINAVEAANGDQVLYRLKKDLKEKQGELEIRASVAYRGHTARVSLKFLIRVVKTFVPPFNYFTLYVKDASVYGGSHFNHHESSGGLQENLKRDDNKPSVGLLRLDNGWNVIRKDFNALTDASRWEADLAQFGNNALTPPGRVYLGQDLNSLMRAGPAVIVRSTNGAKLLFGSNVDPNDRNARQVNGQENFFLRFDVPWYGMKDYVKNFMELQGQKKTKEGLIFTGWGNKTKIRLFNIGSGKELTEIPPIPGGPPSFINCFQTYQMHTGELIKQTPGAPTSSEAMMKARLMPPVDRSGFDPFGNMPPIGGSRLAPDSPADATKLSPTLIYGPAMRQYFRAVQVHPDGGEPFELPFIATGGPIITSNPNINSNTKLTATQARDLFTVAGVSTDFAEKIFRNWEKLPDGLRELDNYGNFMSDSGVELYNRGLGNFLQRTQGETSEYSGPLKDAMGGFLENFPYPYDKIPKGMDQVIKNSPMLEFYEGALWHALPDPYSAYLLDFYFIPRSTEDFFRGRTTVAIGGTSYDRFDFKYINNVQAYRSGANNQTLELNGILALNDSEPLYLRNLKFRGHSVIYSSPMMGGGPVTIEGDLVGIDTDINNFNSSIGNDMITIIAPQIVIRTTHAQGSRCFVEANLISVSEPLMVYGDKPITIKGTVVTPYLNLEEHFATPGENVIVYNALNGIWRNAMPQLMDKQYVAKIVTGGVGKFDWKYEREN